MKMKLFFLTAISILCLIRFSFFSPLTLLATPVPQELMATLNIKNNMDQTICHVYAMRRGSNEVVIDFTNSFHIEPGDSKSFSVPSGDFDVLLRDCNDKDLLDRRNLTIEYEYELVLSQEGSRVTERNEGQSLPDVSQTTCNIYNQRGMHAYSQNHYSEAVTAFQSALTCFRELDDRVSEGNILNSIGVVYNDQGLYSEALEWYEQGLAIQREIGDRAGEGVTLYFIATVYVKQRHQEKALEYYEDALAILQEVGAWASAATTLNEIGLIYEGQGYYDKALERYEQSLVIFRRERDRVGEATALDHIAAIYSARARYSEALEYYEEALAITREVDDSFGEATILIHTAVVYQNQGRYSEALARYEQALSISQEQGDRTNEGTIHNNIAGVYSVRGRFEEAINHYNEALAIFHELRDRMGEATTFNHIGLLYRIHGLYNEALAYHEQALAIIHEQDDRAGEGTTFNGIGAVYFELGRYDKALANLEQALNISRELNDRATEAATLNNIALVYRDQGRYGQARTSLEQALAIQREIGDPVTGATTLANIGEVYRAQGRYDEALAYLEQALAVDDEVGIRATKANTLNNIAIVYINQGRYGQALATLEQALAIHREVDARAREGTTLNSIGNLYRAQGRYDEALVYFQQGLAISRKVEDHSGEGTTLNNIGVIYMIQQRHDEALVYMEQALSIFREAGHRDNEGVVLNNIANVYINQEHYADALAYSEQALAILQEVGNQVSEATALGNIASVYAAQGRYDEALTNYEQALVISQRVGDRAVSGTIFSSIGEVYADQGQFGEALAYFKQALTILEMMRSEAGSDTGRARFIDQHIDLYSRSIYVSQQLGLEEPLFTLAERGRARVFLDSFITGQVQLEDNTAANLLDQERALYAERQALQDTLTRSRILIPPAPEQVAALELKINEVEKAYANVQFEIAGRNEQLSGVTLGNSNILSLDEVQALLERQTTLISYWILEDTALAFIISADDFNVVELPYVTKATIEAAAGLFQEWNYPESPPHPRPLRNLYQMLVKPLISYLQTSHVAIIPHQKLHYVPFAALTDGKSYFGEKYLLTQLPSASVLPFLNQNAARAAQNEDGDVVVLGNPVTNLSALPYAEEEAVEVADSLDTTVYTGTAASELQLRTTISGAHILHLAAHGIYSETNPLASAIVLAVDTDKAYDGSLETREIFGLPLQGNDLVTLSACETNVGEISRGDEVVGLTRAFFFAGSPTVISSLWNVNDSATGALMKAFYQHWQAGMSKAEALQAAQADVRADPRWASPYYWAGFVLNGHPGTPLKTTQPE